MHKKKILSLILAVITLFTVTMVTVSAESQSVNLATNKEYALSGNFKAKGSYISGSTSNSSSSKQRLRAHCHYKEGFFSSWCYDKRVFIDPGKNLGTNTYSYKFENAVYWRLGLSPEVEKDKGVSGSGTIVSVN